MSRGKEIGVSGVGERPGVRFAGAGSGAPRRGLRAPVQLLLPEPVRTAMKVITLLPLLMLAITGPAMAQPVCAPAYDYLDAEAALKTVLLLDDNWEYVVDNERGIDQFRSHKDVARNARILPIPVFELDTSRFMHYNGQDSLCNYYVPSSNYHLYSGFLTKHRRAVNILLTRRPNARLTYPENYLGMNSTATDKLYAAYEAHPQAFFYDTTFRTYAYFYKASISFWSFEKRRFIDFNRLVTSAADLAAMKQCFKSARLDLVDDVGCDFANFFANGKAILLNRFKKP